MIKNSELREDSVEKLFCIPFSNQEQEELTKEDFQIFLKLSLAERNNPKESLDPKALPSQNYEVLASSLRNGRFKFEITEEAAIMVSMMCRVIGDVIMYMAYLQYHYAIEERDENKKITMSRLANIFPMGFPSSTALDRMWESQKTERAEDFCDNLLDHKECYKSIS